MMSTTTPDYDKLTSKVAIDCEMVPSNVSQLLGQVSVVNYDGEIIVDTFVCYPQPIKVTSTDERYSGISWDDLDSRNGARSFADVQNDLVEILQGRTVVGHDIAKDVEAISFKLASGLERLAGSRLPLPRVAFDFHARDTQKYSKFQQYAIAGAHQGPNLKNLSYQVLGRRIKLGRISSVEDARATMEIYKTVEDDLDREQSR